MKKDFNEFRFGGLNHKDASNKYFTMDRVNADETKIVVKISDSHIFGTKYGYAIILDYSHILYVKDWQVSRNHFGNELLLTKEFFNPREYDKQCLFDENPDALKWEHWVEVAKEQSGVDEDGCKLNPVKWEK